MLRALAEVVFPATCPGCGGRGEPVCVACSRTIRGSPPVSPPTGVDALHVPFAYEGVVRELVARAKYRHRHAALTWLATAMARELDAAVDLVAVVTDHCEAATRARSFDQAEVLATAVARRLGVPCPSVLRRVGDDHQTGLSRAARIGAPRFAVRRSARITGRHVLVVDDVVTTGATIGAAATALRSAGAERVEVLAAARRVEVAGTATLGAGGRMDSTVTRLARLREDIAAGTYAPPADAVAEALVGWIALPSQFEWTGRDADDDGNAGTYGSGREGRR